MKSVDGGERRARPVHGLFAPWCGMCSLRFGTHRISSANESGIIGQLQNSLAVGERRVGRRS